MVDNEMALTFSVRNNPGVYALLLGSGISTEAGVPTGWGVVKDLIRKLAEIEGEEIETDPEEWYQDTYNQEPEYDDLIEQVAPSKPDRQSLLEKYFEPTSEEREQDIKTPSEAHRSIAWLMDEGYISIVVTTNFDQLLEQALSERGITPVVISSESDAKGAAPLSHQEAVILKVNGDYKETNIKNIPEELENYSAPIEEKLNKMFDEYGLIVCGWSGDWDIALREAMLRCERRRYATYWAYHGSLEDSADELIAHRDGTPIQITGAGDFFSELKENVEALEGSESGAPLTREVARERVKRYMTREERKIDLADLLHDETEEVRSRVFNEDKFPLDIDVNDDNYDERLSMYESGVRTLVVATSTCAYWGPEVTNSALQPLAEQVRRLGSTGSPDGTYNHVWDYLRMYPAMLVLYGTGISSLKSGNWELMHELLIETEIDAHDFIEQSAGGLLNPWTVGSGINRGRGGNRFLRKRMEKYFREPLREFLPDGKEYTNLFHEYEAFADLILLDRLGDDSLDNVQLKGTLYYDATLEQLRDELDSQSENWGPIDAGFFDGSVDRANFLLDELKDMGW
ncbi:SIR2 family protein [Halococcus sediminicola]|uniref:SIR2 family protein n=1 Tax=Halococcus sediminicola TaxID=1264579 RepID=UPI0012AB383A|nr:SIR2 family protein [Halococcus sediminicola]